MDTEAALRGVLRRLSGFMVLVQEGLAPVVAPQAAVLIMSLCQTLELDVVHPTALQATFDVRESKTIEAPASSQHDINQGSTSGGENRVPGDNASQNDGAVAEVSRALTDSSRLQATAYYRHPVQHVTERQTKLCVARVFDLLAQYGGLDTLVQASLDVFSGANPSALEACYVCNELLLAAARTSTDSTGSAQGEEVKLVAQMVLAEYIASDVWRQPGSDGESASLKAVQRRALLVALVLEGVGHVAQLFGPGFSSKLIDSLFPVLARLGDSHPVVRQVRCCVM